MGGRSVVHMTTADEPARCPRSALRLNYFPIPLPPRRGVHAAREKLRGVSGVCIRSLVCLIIRAAAAAAAEQCVGRDHPGRQAGPTGLNCWTLPRPFGVAYICKDETGSSTLGRWNEGLDMSIKHPLNPPSLSDVNCWMASGFNR